MRNPEGAAQDLIAVSGLGTHRVWRTALAGGPDHDAQAVAETLGPAPEAGFFCNGEIGPVGSRIFLHGFTVSIGLIVSAGATA